MGSAIGAFAAGRHEASAALSVSDEKRSPGAVLGASLTGMRVQWTLAACLSAGLAACEKRGVGASEGVIQVSSPSFAPGGAIPKKHAAAPDGQDVFPALQWSGVPSTARELVVIVEDIAPHKHQFVQFVAYGIAPTATGLPEGLPNDVGDANGVVFGRNDFGHLGWGGPNPVDETPVHRYAFWVYAVNKSLGLASGATKEEVVAAMGPHILANGRLLGSYGR